MPTMNALCDKVREEIGKLNLRFLEVVQIQVISSNEIRLIGNLPSWYNVQLVLTAVMAVIGPQVSLRHSFSVSG